jgi:MYXO-CTERM domain-containing protein
MSGRVRLALVAAVSLVLALGADEARAFCPSYTPADTAGTQHCGVDPAPGTNPTDDAWHGIFATVAGGQASWGAGGPDIGTMGAGCGKPNPTQQVPAHFPCHVLMAIAMQESGWQQFCVPDAPASEVGKPERTIVAFDCGYGVGQVTTGMHVGETPAFDRAKVAGDALYNLATGTLILRDKWAATKCVGDNDPDVVEDWYTAIWAYNGLAYSNNPNNPNLTAGRGPYDPTKGGSYTYQERVFGWMEHPPDASHWDVLAAAYPNRGDVGTTGSPPELPPPSCASPSSCAQTRATHASTCPGTTPDGGIDDAATPPPPPADASSEDGAAPILAAEPTASSGCSCETAAPRAPHVPGLLAAAALTLAAVLRRMRRRRSDRARTARATAWSSAPTPVASKLDVSFAALVPPA